MWGHDASSYFLSVSPLSAIYKNPGARFTKDLRTNLGKT